MDSCAFNCENRFLVWCRQLNNNEQNIRHISIYDDGAEIVSTCVCEIGGGADDETESNKWFKKKYLSPSSYTSILLKIKLVCRQEL
jgi:hypothetical protein